MEWNLSALDKYKCIKKNRLGYWIEGRPEKLVRVTTVLNERAKPRLISWAAEQAALYARERLEEYYDPGAEEYAVPHDKLHAILDESEKAWQNKRDEAADKGTGIHGLIDEYLSGKAPAFETPDQEYGFNEWLKWYRNSGYRIVDSEVFVCSPILGIAGTVDAIGYNRQAQLTIFDWKTGGVWPEVMMQLAAYGRCLREMGAMPSDMYTPAWIPVHVPRKAGDTLQEYEVMGDLRNAEESFLGLLAVRGLNRMELVAKIK